MPVYEIRWSRKAVNYLKRLELATRKRIVEAIETLASDPSNCFLQAKNAYHCSRRSNGPGSAFLLLATSHKRMANPVTWTVKNNEMTVVH